MKTVDKNNMPEVLEAQEGLDMICDFVLGEDYYIVDPLSNKQANVIVVLDIINAYIRMKERSKVYCFIAFLLEFLHQYYAQLYCKLIIVIKHKNSCIL